MKVFDFLKIMNPDLEPNNTKIHLATWNGVEDPLQVYLGGEFDDWQKWQSKLNFERKYVASFISLRRNNSWLFAGIYLSHGAIWDEQENQYQYSLVDDALCEEMSGRMVMHFSRSGRASYLIAENWSNQMHLAEVYAERLTIGDFPGYRSVDLSREELLLIFKQQPDTWQTALSNVAGIYLISDRQTGRLYVGAAYGQGGIWQRWAAYADTGHGGNVQLRELIKVEGDGCLNAFRYSILEVADIHCSDAEILAREGHWKSVLLTRDHGFNSN